MNAQIFSAKRSFASLVKFFADSGLDFKKKEKTAVTVELLLCLYLVLTLLNNRVNCFVLSAFLKLQNSKSRLLNF